MDHLHAILVERFRAGLHGTADYNASEVVRVLKQAGYLWAPKSVPEVRAQASQAVLDYFDTHVEAGKPPFFHHRCGIADAVISVLTNDNI